MKISAPFVNIPGVMRVFNELVEGMVLGLVGTTPSKFDFNEKMLLALKTNDTEQVRCLLHLDPKIALRKIGRNGETSLIMAAMAACPWAIEILLPVSDANARDKLGWTALMHAANLGRSESVGALLPSSNAKVADNDGLTALMLAALVGSPESVAMLLPASNPWAKNDAGMTAADMARECGDDGLAGLLDSVAEAGELAADLSGAANTSPITGL